MRQRDRYYVLDCPAGLFTATLTSGGYTKRSAGLIADAASYLLKDVAVPSTSPFQR